MLESGSLASMRIVDRTRKHYKRDYLIHVRFTISNTMTRKKDHDRNDDLNLRFNRISNIQMLRSKRKHLISYLKIRLKLKCLFQAAGLTKPENKNDHDSDVEIKVNPRREALRLRVIREVTEEIDFDNLTEQIQAKPSLLGLLQVYAEIPSQDTNSLKNILAFAEANFSNLAFTKSGAHLIRTLMTRSQGFSNVVLRYSKHNIKLMVSNDFACRVLRSVMREFASFRRHAVQFIRHDLDFCLDNFPSIFIVTEAIRMSDSMNDFDFLAEALEINPNKVLASRYFKRILVTFSEYCNLSQFKRLENALNLQDNFDRYLNDKFCTTVLTILMSRDSQKCFQALTYMAKSDPVKLLHSLKFDHFILRLLVLLPEDRTAAIFSILQLIKASMPLCKPFDGEYTNRLLFISYSLLVSSQSCCSPSVLDEVIAWSGSIAKYSSGL